METKKRITLRCKLLWVVCGVLVIANLVHAATVTVNPSIVHQTIQGIGAACEGVDCPYICGEGKYPGSDQYQRYVQDIADMGMTMMRLHGGPDECDMGSREDNAKWMKDIQAAVRARGDDDTVRFIFSTWTPKAEWKDNRSIYAGTLLPQYYSNFADYLVQYYKDVEALSGCKIYAADFANEPSFANPFWACVYTPAQYVNMLKVFGPKMQAGVPHIKVMVADELETTTGFQIPDAIIRDATAKSYVRIFCVHYYQEWAPSASATSNTASHWVAVADRARQLNNSGVIMSETSTYCDRWDGNTSCQTSCCGSYDKSAFYYAYGMMAAFLWGRAEAWTNYGVWEQVEDAPPENRANSKAVMMHYSRHIKPGAVALETSATDNILALAFRHPRKGTHTLVMLNLNTTAQTVTVNWPGAPSSFQGFQSSATKRYASMGTVNLSNVSMDPRSIVTLTAAGGTGLAYSSTIAQAPRRTEGGREELYTVLGSHIRGNSTPARGVYVTRSGPGSVAVRTVVR